MQNLVLVNMPNGILTPQRALSTELGLPVAASPFARGTIACTGSEFCKLALTETKSFARWLVEELEDRIPGFDEQLKLHIAGCPNSCGQHWIADIGLEGKKVKVAGGWWMPTTSAWAAPSASLRRSLVPLVIAAPRRMCLKQSSVCCEVLRKIASSAKICGDFLRAIRTMRSACSWPGQIADAVARDLSAGPVPHGIEG